MSLPAPVRDCAVEMDTVVGRQGRDRQRLLSLFFRLMRSRLYVLLPSGEAADVVAALARLRALCGDAEYGRLFATVLTDRGSEFSDVAGIEAAGGDRPLTRLFFCDPRQSQQKGGCERCHEELRRVLPKARTDFDALTAADAARCTSHVDSYLRDSLGWASPVAVARYVFPEGLLEALGVSEVPAAEVNLTPSLVPHAVVRL